MQIAIVTGGTSGIGLATVKSLINKGVKIYEFSRRDLSAEETDSIAKSTSTNNMFNHLRVDVTDEPCVIDAVNKVFQETGHIDILINCAGFGISGAVEYTDYKDAKRQFDVNFFGMVNVTKAVIPIMRNARSGKIINISSVAAVAPIPFQTYYSASKAAINSYTCALANEVRPFGIHVTAIMPGDIRTNFTAARAKSSSGDDVYSGRISRSVSKMEHDEQNGMSPDIAGKYITQIALKRNVKPIYSVGFSYKFLSALCNVMPVRFKNWLLGKLYG